MRATKGIRGKNHRRKGREESHFLKFFLIIKFNKIGKVQMGALFLYLKEFSLFFFFWLEHLENNRRITAKRGDARPSPFCSLPSHPSTGMIHYVATVDVCVCVLCFDEERLRTCIKYTSIHHSCFSCSWLLELESKPKHLRTSQ